MSQRETSTGSRGSSSGESAAAVEESPQDGCGARELARLKRRLELILDAVGEGIYGLDAAGRTTFVNRVAAEFVGWEREEIVGRKQHELLHHSRPDGTPYPAEECPIYRAFRDGEVHRVSDEVFWRKDGTSFPVEYVSTPIREEGEVTGAVVVFRDVTDREKARRALEESQRLLASVTNGSLDAIMAFRALRVDGAVVDFEWLLANRRAAEVAGRTEEELRGRRLLEEMPVYGENGLFEAFAGVVDTGEPFSGEYLFALPEGEPRWLQVTAVRLGDGVAVTYRDVTERRRAEEALRESEQRFRLVAENASDLVCLQEPDGRFAWVSPSVHRILGFEPGDLLGETPFAFIHPEDAETVRRELLGPLQQGEPFSGATYRMLTAAGDYRWMETSCKALQDASGRTVRIRASSRDVTERVRAERAESRYRTQLELRNRELQDFAYVASHDLQEPLRKIQAFSDLLREDYDAVLDETALLYLDRVQDAASRMSGLINDLLAFSRVTTRGNSFERVELETVVAGVLSDLEAAVRRADADVQVGPLPAIDADPMQMRQLFQNLIGNAVKFARPGQRPVVRVAGALEANRLLGGRRQAVCRLTVRDNGIGFDEKYLDRIFTPFQRLHHREQYEGTGMGLAICRRIAERHGGTITAESAPGEGSTFIVLLPARQDHATETENP